MLTREQATAKILAAKQKSKLTWEQIAKGVGRHKIWTTAALLGQHPMSAEESESVVKILGFAEGEAQEVSSALQEFPMRGSLDSAVPVDPTIYRFYELIQVYGPTIKALIHEEFGDGIMSAIDFDMELKRKEDPKGDRVVVTLNGKFLPYKKF
ncbi:MAG: cyanase [Deltaproteobacteria bacterium]|nr:cyanase [Deltaproteobacteria bacterium]MBI2180225.1 cyanase [Deltaproteobacteria bacterium]MBI2228074.1 cyanase [Deltaproteobacteria bacterium]MBI2368607.1 cyanase [Deltaproteobacteria bacterium]MBI2533094.1 cyanase [Deltaproteobacteria bacterium]